jgi:hypothetical protein
MKRPSASSTTLMPTDGASPVWCRVGLTFVIHSCGTRLRAGRAAPQSSSISPVVIGMTWTALPITSTGRASRLWDLGASASALCPHTRGRLLKNFLCLPRSGSYVPSAGKASSEPSPGSDLPTCGIGPRRCGTASMRLPASGHCEACAFGKLPGRRWPHSN